MARWIDDERDWLPQSDRGKPAGPPAEAPRAVADDPPSIPTAVWIPVLCPHCGSRDCPVVASPKANAPGVRYHHCRACETAFKSIERLIRR